MSLSMYKLEAFYHRYISWYIGYWWAMFLINFVFRPYRFINKMILRRDVDANILKWAPYIQSRTEKHYRFPG